MIAILLASCAICLCIIYKLRRRRRPTESWTKGPLGLPVFGNLLQFTFNPPLQFSKWAVQYGSIYTLWFGTQRALIINDTRLIKQIFSKRAATGKPYSAIFNIMYPTGGIVISNGETWKEQRTVFIKILKQFSSRSKLEDIIRLETEKFCGVCKTEMETDGKVYIGHLLKALVSNIIWAIITGNSKESQVANLMEDWIESLKVITKAGVAFFPWLGVIAPKLTGYSEFKQRTNNLREFVRKQISDEQAKNNTANNVITAYLNHVANTTDKSSSFYGKLGLEHSFDSIFALLLAGTETTSTTLNWVIFHLIANPSIQEKLAQEIRSGESTTTGVSYVDAVIDETLRVSPVVPFGLIHELEESIELNGIVFPKGIQLVPNIPHGHFYEEVWGKDAKVFRPDRFMENYGLRKGLRENLATFQPGRRVCPGEQLARDLMHLVVSELMKKIEFRPAEGVSTETYLHANYSYIAQPNNVPLKPSF